MRKMTILAALGLIIMAANARAAFEDFFTDRTMRIDYYHSGDSKSESITLDHVSRYGTWAGSTTNLIDRFNYGRYIIRIYKADDRQLVYSKGFDCYFGEYKTSDPAAKGIKKTYHETALIPCPKGKIIFSIEMRDKKNVPGEIFSQEIDPDDIYTTEDKPADTGIEVIQALNSGDPHKKVDVAFIAEGYTLTEKDKFIKDLETIRETFFSQEPYKSNRGCFNIWGVFKASAESGVDEPDAGIYRNTAVGATFGSLGSERYLMTEDNKALRDIAAYAPYDAICIMVNTKRYGGGGIYNLYATFPADNQWRDYIVLHEFGHSFTGLADEYYTSETAYNDLFPAGIEPMEPNITAHPTKDSLKWIALATPGIELPTPWEKKGFDAMDLAWQKLRRELNKNIANLKRSHASKEKIAAAEDEYARLDKEHSGIVDDYLNKSKFRGMTGAFEGAGYATTGLFRPMIDCIMFTKGKKPYCSVCGEAVARMVKSYCE